MLPRLRFKAARLRPSFLIIGAQKAGTSALFNMLSAHDRILPPNEKELHFFDQDISDLNMTEYWEQFPLTRRKGLKTMEATPNYLGKTGTAERIATALPDVKLVVILRDPISRAYSAWNMFRDFKEHPKYQHLYESRSFEDAIDQEIAGRNLMYHQRYLVRGHYAVQLNEYFEYFPENAFYITSYTEFRNDPVSVVNDICSFIGIEQMDSSEEVFKVRKNVREYATSMSDEVRQRLEKYYEQHNEALRKMLGADFEF